MNDTMHETGSETVNEKRQKEAVDAHLRRVGI